MNAFVFDAITAAVEALDNHDHPVGDYPDAIIAALARAGYAVVPTALPFDVLGEAAISGVCETGNPKHTWDYLLAKVRVMTEIGKGMQG